MFWRYLSARYWIIIPILAATIFYILPSGILPFEDADEATYALVVREMLRGGDWLTLHLFDQTWIDKPPLLFWLMAISAKIFGLKEFALRLPVALLGVVAIFLTTKISYELTKNKLAALFGGLALVFFPLFLAAAKNVRFDVPVIAAILSALFFFLRGRSRQTFLSGVGISLAIGIMFKSIISLLAVPVLLIFSFFLKDAQNVIHSQITTGYALWVFLKYSFPWSALFPVAIFTFLTLIRYLNFYPVLRPIISYGWSILVSVLALSSVFALTGTKLITYFIPTYPFIVLFLAVVWSGAYQVTTEKWRVILKSVVWSALVIGAIFSFREAFINSRLYVTRTAADSKAIGLLLSQGQQWPIYLYEYQPDQTIQYYAQKRVEHLTEQSSDNLSVQFYLVIPTDLVKENPWLSDVTGLYSGKYLSLFEVK
ncbi:MAG: glycosyl transferase protein [Parcubacteria group bacterium Gr01-1014_19]|nr:MAG: glycosyl transferase protein [Parcubacteria group bacterium Gr01-1014_19]